MSNNRDLGKNVKRPSKSPETIQEKPSGNRSPTPNMGNSPQIIQYWGLPLFQKSEANHNINQLKIDEEIFQIFPGESHAFMSSKKNNFYVVGNNEFGQLGLGHTDNVFTPLLFEIKIKHQISKISTGSDFVFMSNSKTEVFSWGSNLKGQLGQGHFDALSTPTKVRVFSPYIGNSGQSSNIMSQTLMNPNEFVISFACGALHTLALTNNGRVFSCGFGETFALGFGNNRTTSNFEEIIHFKDQSLKISKIAAGTSHSGCLVNNQVYLWGTCGSAKSLQYKKPTLIDGEFDIVTFCLGDFLTVFLTSKCEVFSLGDNIDGQLGTNSVINLTPKKINLPYKVDYIDCGLNHVIALSKYKIFSWGSNRKGQIHPRISQLFFDAPIELEWITNSMPSAIHCGPQQTYLISNKPVVLPEKMGSEIDNSKILRKEIDNQRGKLILLKKENDKLKEDYTQLINNPLEYRASDPSSGKSVDPNEEIMKKFKSELKINRTLRPSFEIDFKELKIVSKISEGAFGIIYKAKWREITVAVKTLKQEYMKEETIKDFLSKIKR